MFLSLMAISTGASCGAILRWLLGSTFNHYWSVMPLGTLLANLVGGCLVGLAVPWLSQPTLSPEWRLLVITGFLGGLTTFSTFSAEVVMMLQSQKYGPAAITVALHLFGSVSLTMLGFWLCKTWMSRA